MDESLTVVPADEDLLDEYDALAARSYGHRVDDITRLGPHADVRVALKHGRIVAGGLGLLIPQFFGGNPVPAACLGSGCVAPEERGNHLAARLLTERIRPLQEQGAVLATLWTASTGYARRLGWQAPTTVFSWSVDTEALRSFDAGPFRIEHGLTPDTEHLQQHLARQWNGPLARPAWWTASRQHQHHLTFYRFQQPGQAASGFLSLASSHDQPGGPHPVVHDFWAASDGTAAAMLSFLGRHHSRAARIEFQRTALPPTPHLLHALPRYRAATAHAWHPWMLRILNPAAAVRLRGWPADLDTAIPVGIGRDGGGAVWDRCLLQISAGSADLHPTTQESKVRLTRGQLAVWYAGGYRTPTAASLSGVRSTCPQALSTLIRATGEHEPWLPDHF
ncbi:enhanced intracellular survival protein Eis [Streptomyces sp. NPDC057620]|uniref:GNAT family N-acetyltransferase n=1 Tax=Streptomyces sp. NPDC057620 TaxID=3346185 RepID=UPI00368B4819